MTLVGSKCEGKQNEYDVGGAVALSTGMRFHAVWVALKLARSYATQAELTGDGCRASQHDLRSNWRPGPLTSMFSVSQHPYGFRSRSFLTATTHMNQSAFLMLRRSERQGLDDCMIV